eukprot:13581273-Alexandrium_andersonii.AAC.1
MPGKSTVSLAMGIAGPSEDDEAALATGAWCGGGSGRSGLARHLGTFPLRTWHRLTSEAARTWSN